MPYALRPTLFRIAAWCSVAALGLLAVQPLAGLPLVPAAALLALVVAAGGFLTARCYARHYRFARLRIGRALATSLGTGLVVGTVAAAGAVLWWTSALALAPTTHQLLVAGGAALGASLVLHELGALAAALLFTWRNHLHTAV